MRNICAVLFLLFFIAFMFCGCSRVIENSVDEITTRDWYAENASGISAALRFEDDTAEFAVYDADGKEAAVIEGALAADNKKLYITDDRYCKTYEFEYSVFGDRAVISYNGVALTFYPLE